MTNKREKAAQYAEDWEEINHPLDFNNMLPTEVSVIDYLAGYNQAIKDSKASEMLEMLKKLYITNSLVHNSDHVQVEQLIKSATEITE